MPETTRDDLHILVELLPECAWDAVKGVMLEHLAEPDAVNYDPMDAPEVEPTPAEVAAIEEYYADLKAGRIKTIPHAEVVKYLLELP